MKSAAECHSAPKGVDPAEKSIPVGALLVVVPPTPCSPEAPGTAAAWVPEALPAFNSSRAEPSEKVSLRALSSSPAAVPSSKISKLEDRVVPPSVVSLTETLKFERSTTEFESTVLSSALSNSTPILKLPAVQESTSYVVMEELKDTLDLPISIKR